MKTNVSSANYWAVANGAGIEVFPTYAKALGGKIVPLDVERHRPPTFGLSCTRRPPNSPGATHD